MHDFESSRSAFIGAATWFADTVAELDLTPPGWEAAALGVWSRRDLVGHTSRALLTVEDYLRLEPSSSTLETIDYYRVVRSGRADPDDVAERGRRAGVDLGPSLPEAVRSIVDRAADLIIRQPADALVSTPVGDWTLAAYLPTRIFELVVHTLDLRRAAGLDGDIPAGPSRAALEVLGILVADSRPEEAPALLTTLTGRSVMTTIYSVL